MRVNLTVPVPLLGGVVGGTFDGMACYMTSQATDRAFRPTAAEHGLEAKIETAVSALEARTTQLEALLIQWRIGTVLAGTTVTAVMTGMVMGGHTLTELLALPLTKAFDNGVTESDDLSVLLTDHGIILCKDSVMLPFSCHGIAFQVFFKRLTLLV